MICVSLFVPRIINIPYELMWKLNFGFLIKTPLTYLRVMLYLVVKTFTK
jgi:hypothetical protein